MIKTLRLMLEYKCYPVWLYDENDNIIDTLLPEELRNDAKLDLKFDDLQARYDALFIDNEHEFSFVGFKTIEEKNSFINDWNSAIQELTEKTEGKYTIINDIDKAF